MLVTGSGENVSSSSVALNFLFEPERTGGDGDLVGETGFSCASSSSFMLLAESAGLCPSSSASGRIASSVSRKSWCRLLASGLWFISKCATGGDPMLGESMSCDSAKS